MRVLLFPGRRKPELWAIHPFRKGMGRTTGLAPPRRGYVWTETPPQLSLLHYAGHRAGATLHRSTHRVQRRGSRSRGAKAPGGVSLKDTGVCFLLPSRLVLLAQKQTVIRHFPV